MTYSIDEIAARSPFFRRDTFRLSDGVVIIDFDAARQIVMEAQRARDEVPNWAGIERTLRGDDGTVSESFVRDAIASFESATDAPVRVLDSAVPFDESRIDGADTQVDTLQFDSIGADFDGDSEAFFSAPSSAFLTDRLFVTNVNGRKNVSLYETADRNNLLGNAVLEGENVDVDEFIDRFRTTTTDDLDALGIEAVGMSQDRQDRRTRRSLREQLDQTLEAEGYDPDEWNTDARADGTLILQDPETNKTKTIEPDSGESGIDSAVESLDSSSDSSTSDSDSTGGEQDSSPGGGADGLGQVGGIMLVAAIATAVYYGVTQL
jgi:hypothetical protein